MSRTILRALIPILLLAAGIGSLVYGAFFHRLQLVEQKSVKVKILIPSPFGPPPVPGGGAEVQPPGASQGGMPTFDFSDPEGQLSSDDVTSPDESEAEKDEEGEEERSPFETPAEQGGDAEETSPFEMNSGDAEEEESPFETPNAGPPGQPPMGAAGPFGPPMGAPSPFGPPGMLGGPPQYIEETELRLVKHDFSEPAVLREMTVGGVSRLADGRLEWTNAGNGAAWCPT